MMQTILLKLRNVEESLSIGGTWTMTMPLKL